MDPKEIGRRIKEFRKQQDLTQSELAERINVSFQQVQKYEQGQTRITLQRLCSIAEALELPISLFLEEERTLKVSEDPAAYSSGEKLLFRLTAEEASFLKQFRKINNQKMRSGLLKLLKGIVESG